MAVDALSEALARADEHGPWVLASAGVGSLYSRIFSSRHGRDVSGVLMIDPLHEDLVEAYVGSARRGFWAWARGALSPLGWDRVPGAVFRGRTSEDRVWGRAAYQSPKFQFAKLQENLVAASYTKREVENSRAIQYKDTPLVLVSSGVMVRRDEDWEAKQRDLTHLTKNLVAWDTVPNATHQVWESYEGRKTIEKRLGQLAAMP